MKKNENFHQILSKALVLLMLPGLLLSWGCQKDTPEPVEIIAANTTMQQRSIEEATVQMVYGFQSSEMSKAEMEKLYTEMTNSLSAEQSHQLDELASQYLKLQTEAPNTTSNNVYFRNTNENILSAGNPGDGFGSGIAKQGNTLFVGASGSQEVYVYGGNSLSQVLTPSNGALSFGANVAVSGNQLAVAACGEVVIFKKQGNTWSEQAIITPNLTFAGACATGTDIAMDGNKLAILGRNNAQSVILVYKLTGNNWSLEDEIDLTAEDIFLWDIDMHANHIVANGGTNANSGILFNPQVFVFEKSGNSWSLDQQVAFPAGQYVLARAVAIHNSTIVANTAFGPLGATNSIIITKSSGSWSISGEIVQPAPLPFSSTRQLAIQGEKIVVTSPAGGFFPNPDDVVHVFESGILTETLTPSTGGSDYVFGERVYIHGNEIGIGAPGEAGIAGTVFIYK